ncbi:hypothetical protein EDB81DRAFT_641419, partial [Dactylonectria macrodidyma]
QQIPPLTGKGSFDCLAIPDTIVDASNLAIRIAVVVARIVQFYRASNSLTTPEEPLFNPTEHRRILRLVIQQAIVIQSELSDIAALHSRRSMPHQIMDEGQAGQDDPTIIFASRWVACIDTLYQAILILFFANFLFCCLALVRLDQASNIVTPDTHLAESSAPLIELQLKKLSGMICASLPYLVDEVSRGGVPLTVPQPKVAILHYLIWPLASVITSPWSTGQQVEGCQERINWIRDRYGINLASVAPASAKDPVA